MDVLIPMEVGPRPMPAVPCPTNKAIDCHDFGTSDMFVNFAICIIVADLALVSDLERCDKPWHFQVLTTQSKLKWMAEIA